MGAIFDGSHQSVQGVRCVVLRAAQVDGNYGIPGVPIRPIYARSPYLSWTKSRRALYTNKLLSNKLVPNHCCDP